MKSGKVFIAGRLLWLAWYPLRGRQCSFGRPPTHNGDWYFHAAIGSLYLGIGPGTPLP